MWARALLFTVALALVAVVLSVATSRATTLVHRGLDELTTGNELVIEGEILEIRSFWNSDHSFILTDATVRPDQFLKGRALGNVTCTLMGGSVGDTTTLIIGGPDLLPGSRYVLFLGRSDLPGARDRLTVRDLAQGAFDVDGGRALSQARGEPLMRGSDGAADVPGGLDGLQLDELARQVRAQSNR